MSEPQHLLLVYAGQPGGRTCAMVAAARAGIDACGEALNVKALPALEAGSEDVLRAQGILLATPEHFGYMSGALKHFFDRTFYPLEGKVAGLPYVLLVSAGNDGSGAVSSVERIVLGYRWKKIAEPVVARGELTSPVLDRCREAGQLLGMGVAMGLF
jgi:multimeric flavodoxin WrbA